MRSSALCVLIAIAVLVATAARANENVEVIPDVVYGHKDGMALTFDVFKPTKDANGAGILNMVSGGWRSTWNAPNPHSYKQLLDHGFTVFAVRHGSSPKYNVPEIVDDVRRSVRFVRLHAAQFGVDPERLGVTGASAGGHLSLLLGTTSDGGDPKAKDEVQRASDRVAAVVAYCPPTDIRPWVVENASKYYKSYPALRFETDKATSYSPLFHVSADDAPTLLIHGDNDTLVPLDHSQRILAEFEKAGVACDLLVMHGAKHAFKGNDITKADDARIDWFTKHLLKK